MAEPTSVLDPRDVEAMMSALFDIRPDITETLRLLTEGDDGDEEATEADS